MEDKIIKTATEMFLKLGFKSVTMDDIAAELCISKKTIYKYFQNKEVLVEAGTIAVQHNIQQMMNTIVAQNYNAIAENFEMRNSFKEFFQSVDHSPAYQLKKQYPEIYHRMMAVQLNECNFMFKKNIEKGIQEGLYRPDIDVDAAVRFYYTLIFSINETTLLEKEAKALEAKALEYHTRALATPKGLEELEKHLNILNY
ncbi:MAG: TetR/AcrR family transcriptional regulator [Flavobacterium sp.]|nr:TetR/AcrR family transcriptional regulator [Flavobacterium sp.]